MQYIQVVERRNVDELVLLDISATEESRRPLFKQITEFTNEIYCPVTIGGGIRELDDISFLLGCGADKVAIRSQVGLIKEASRKFGAQAIVAVIDFKNEDGIQEAVEYAQNLEENGAGEILLTDVEKDGTMDGYNLSLVANVANSVSIPVICNGGCSGSLDMVNAIKAGASAVAAGSLFLYTDTTPKDCANFLHDAAIPVRRNIELPPRTREEYVDKCIYLAKLNEQETQELIDKVNGVSDEEWELLDREEML